VSAFSELGKVIGNLNLKMKIVNLIKNDDSKQLKKEIKTNPDLLLLSRFHKLTFLMISVSDHAYDCTRVLIQSGVDVDETGNNGETALMIAVIHGNLKGAQYLLDHGAAISIRSSYNETAFEILMREKSKCNVTDWFELFSNYKDKFDGKDAKLFKEYRLSFLLKET
jgi:ankyrin repeat protein